MTYGACNRLSSCSCTRIALRGYGTSEVLGCRGITRALRTCGAGVRVIDKRQLTGSSFRLNHIVTLSSCGMCRVIRSQHCRLVDCTTVLATARAPRLPGRASFGDELNIHSNVDPFVEPLSGSSLRPPQSTEANYIRFPENRFQCCLANPATVSRQ